MKSQKTRIVTALVAFLCISISACEDKEEPIGKWSDNIKLSTRSADLSADIDSVAITTQGDWWWIDGIKLQDSSYHYYGREDIDLESDSYSILEESFIVERRNKTELFIKMMENTSGVDRTLHIYLQAGNYFDYVAINQAGQ